MASTTTHPARAVSTVRTVSTVSTVSPKPVRSQHARAAASAAAPRAVRLTRRGRLVVAVVVLAVVTMVSLWVGGAAFGGTAAAPQVRVVVQSGDTLWSIARDAAPGADPRATIEALREINQLRPESSLVPGQSLLLPSGQ